MKAVIPVTDPNSLLRSLLASSGDCIKILDLDGNLIFMTETGQKIMDVTDFSSIQGCPWPDFWQGQGNTEAKNAVETARAGGTGHFVGPASTMAGVAKWWDVTVTLIRDAEGKPDRLLSISRDITTAHNASAALRESGQRLELALAAADIGTWDFNPQSGQLTWDDRCYELFGLTPGASVSFERFLEGLHPNDRAATEKACLDAMRPDGSRFYDIEYRTIGLEDGIERWCSAKGQGLFDNQTCIRFIGTIIDIGRLKEAQQHAALLTLELEHRLKNNMAMVGAIASQTFRAAQTKEEASQNFDARLHALARAHGILTKSSWTRASMRSVVEQALLPHRSAENRIRISGPDAELSARRCLSLSLALHELATNAAKYGALSVPEGTIDVHWERRRKAGGPDDLCFRWEEKNGPPVSPPTRKGFGTRLIANTLAGDFGPDAKVEFAHDGLVCSFKCSVDELSEAEL